MQVVDEPILLDLAVNGGASVENCGRIEVLDTVYVEGVTPDGEPFSLYIPDALARRIGSVARRRPSRCHRRSKQKAGAPLEHGEPSAQGGSSASGRRGDGAKAAPRRLKGLDSVVERVSQRMGEQGYERRSAPL